MHFKTRIESFDTREIVNSEFINWNLYKNKTILITGATGLIGKQIVNALLYANENLSTNITILAHIRNKEKADRIFWQNSTRKLKYIVQDIEKPFKYSGPVDFIIHTANSTSSQDFAEKPVETTSSIIIGTKNILDFAKEKNVKGVIYLSSMEVYGETNINRKEPLKESDLSYINLSNPRNSYPEAKRLAENLCASYSKEYGVPVKVARLAQTIGACVDYNDKRVFAEFARNIVEKKDIVLHTKGESTRSYCYITDAISAMFALLEKGKSGECYNVANSETTCSIKEMAEMLCSKHKDSELKYDLKDNNFYLGTINYNLDIEKIKSATGWQPQVDMETIYERLISNFIGLKDKKSDKITKLQNIFYMSNNLDNKVIILFGIKINIPLKYFAKIHYLKPIKRNKIVFSNFNGNGYGCNPKYIAEEILRRKLPYDLVWVSNNPRDNKDYPKGIRVVKPKKIGEIVTAKFIVNNVRSNNWIRRGWEKRDGQYYIQTWHGSLGIKKIDGAVKSKTFKTEFWVECAKKDSSYIDYLVSNSQFEDDVYKSSLWYDGEIKRIGHPRNDIFFKSQDEKNIVKQKVKSFFNIKDNQKIFLYAPSYRDNYTIDCFNIDTQRIKESLSKKFGGEWVIIARLHPNLKDVKGLFEYSDTVKDGGKYSDIQELMVTSDIMLTDYSSCIFDFMLSRKPGFIYATDIEKYDNDRGFYYPLTSTPFPVATNNDELINNISFFDEVKYKNDVENFLTEKGCMEDGQASKRIVDIIEEVINNG